jgi:hypothetical protein
MQPIHTHTHTHTHTQLIDKRIIKHKSTDVQLHAACCVAEVLRLSVPDLPYKAVDLKVMFETFFKQLREVWVYKHVCMCVFLLVHMRV